MKKLILSASACLIATFSQATTTVFNDEAAFLANAGAVSFDSFEDLAIASPVEAIQRDDYVISSSIADNLYGIYVLGPMPGFGSFSTDGDIHLAHQGDVGEHLRFDFDAPVNSFGFTLTDWDNPAMTDGAQLVLGNSAGDEVVILAAPMMEGEALFFGIVNTSFAFSYVELRNTAQNEAFGIDGLYVSSQVPLPAAFWLLATAIAGFLPFRRSGRNTA